MDRFRQAIGVRKLSRRTEKSYAGWIRRFVRFHRGRHPRQLAAAEIGAFLAHLAIGANVSASTQSQALSALLFLYKSVLEMDPGWVEGLPRPKRPSRVPVVLTPGEVRRLLERMAGVPRLVAHLLYGGGLRLLEALQLRIQDVDYAANEVIVRRGKGAKDRRTMLPQAAQADLAEHLTRVHEQHEADFALGAGWVALPEALGRKYPSAGRE